MRSSVVLGFRQFLDFKEVNKPEHLSTDGYFSPILIVWVPVSLKPDAVLGLVYILTALIFWKHPVSNYLFTYSFRNKHGYPLWLHPVTSLQKDRPKAGKRANSPSGLSIPGTQVRMWFCLQSLVHLLPWNAVYYSDGLFGLGNFFFQLIILNILERTVLGLQIFFWDKKFEKDVAYSKTEEIEKPLKLLRGYIFYEQINLHKYYWFLSKM